MNKREWIIGDILAQATLNDLMVKILLSGTREGLNILKKAEAHLNSRCNLIYTESWENVIQ